MAMICLGVIAFYILLALLSPMMFPDWENSANYTERDQGPSWRHPLGTDSFGRGVLSKTILGARTSLSVAFVVNIAAIPLGMLLGAIAGYFGKWVDDIIVWLFTTLAAIPGLVRIIAIKFAFEDTILFKGKFCELDLSGMAGVYLAIMVTFWIGTCRLVRAETMKLRDQDFVLAARAVGRSHWGILTRHIMPNVMHIGIIQLSLGFIGAITMEVMIRYLGLGGGVGTPSWGAMINAGRTELLTGNGVELLSAVVAMFFLILALSLLGDRLRDALDPKLKNA
jgi:ABC-type dipeptide/oligopeptide/nickel transport system permease subunit